MRKPIKIAQIVLSWLFAALLLTTIAGGVRSGLDPDYYILSIPFSALGVAVAIGLLLGNARARKCAAGLCLFFAIGIPFMPMVSHSTLDATASLIRIIPAVIALLGAAYVLDYREKPRDEGPKGTAV